MQNFTKISQMNGLCGGASSSNSTNAAGVGSPNRRGGVISGSGNVNSSGSGLSGSNNTIVQGYSTPQPAACNPSAVDAMRKSRSQGGKKLQKCLSTASYGEESSISRLQMAPLSHNLLMTRQYCSFGSTTSNFFLLFLKF